MRAEARCAYLASSDGPPFAELTGQWLSPEELAGFDKPAAKHRPRDWLMGRIAAKHLILRLLAEENGDACALRHGRLVQPRQITIRSRGRAGQGVAPEIIVDHGRLAWTVSIAHTLRGALAAVVTGGSRVGVDLIDRAEVRAAGLRYWFTPRERCWVAGCRQRATVLWGVKEAVYKACNHGESFAPRQVEVFDAGGGQFAGRYHRCGVQASGVAQTWSVDGHLAVLFRADESRDADGESRTPPTIHNQPNAHR